MFEKELKFFIKHQKELVSKHRGKVLVIVGDEVVGVYSTMLQAYTEAQKSHKLGTFMLQPCKPGPEAYTATISTNCIAVS